MKEAKRSFRALPGRFVERIFGGAKVVRGVDQRNVGQCLRKVAGQTLRARVVLLRQQTDVVCE